MYRYRYTGEDEQTILEIHRTVRPGEEFDSPVPLNNINLQPVTEKTDTKRGDK